jgi:hypothetical protein
MRAYISHVAFIKGEPEDELDNRGSKDELSSTFNTLLVDIKDSKEYYLDSYFTLVQILFTTPDLQLPNVLLNTTSNLIN